MMHPFDPPNLHVTALAFNVQLYAICCHISVSPPNNGAIIANRYMLILMRMMILSISCKYVNVIPIDDDQDVCVVPVVVERSGPSIVSEVCIYMT